jgi:hypothetical protein
MMETVFVRTSLLLAVAVLVFVAIGCGQPSQQTVSTVDTSPTDASYTPDTSGTPTSDAAAAPRTPAGTIAIDPQPAPQSGEVRIAGKGFAAGETVTVSVTQTADPASTQMPLANATVNDDGSFDPVTLSLPDELLSGAHGIDAAGQTSGRHSTGTLWIRAPQPWLVMDSYDVPQYGQLGMVAGGFEPMDQVQVSLEPANGGSGTPVQLANLTTDQAGNAKWIQVKLPRMTAGTYSIVLHGQASTAELRRDMRVTVLKPTIELSPWAGPPGVPVQMNVRGFGPSEHVHVSVGGTPDPLALEADEYGNLWGAGPVRVPQNATPGTLALQLVGDDTGAIVTAEFKVLEPKPWLELTSWSGAPGAPVGFAGGGWIGGEQVGFHIGSAKNPELATAIADDNGWLKGAGPVYIPNDADDDVMFVAVGAQSHLVAAATFRLILPFGLRPSQSPVPRVPQVKAGG